MKQQFYVYGDKSILKDIRIERYISAEESDTGMDIVYTLFDGKKLHAYYTPDTYSYICIKYKNKFFFINGGDDFERANGFEHSIYHLHIIKYNNDIYVNYEQGSKKYIKATMTNNPIDNNMSNYTKLMSYDRLQYPRYILKEKINQVFFSDMSSK